MLLQETKFLLGWLLHNNFFPNSDFQLGRRNPLPPPSNSRRRRRRRPNSGAPSPPPPPLLLLLPSGQQPEQSFLPSVSFFPLFHLLAPLSPAVDTGWLKKRVLNPTKTLVLILNWYFLRFPYLVLNCPPMGVWKRKCQFLCLALDA